LVNVVEQFIASYQNTDEVQVEVTEPEPQQIVQAPADQPTENPTDSDFVDIGDED